MRDNYDKLRPNLTSYLASLSSSSKLPALPNLLHSSDYFSDEISQILTCLTECSPENFRIFIICYKAP